jgi:hypothetical protein
MAAPVPVPAPGESHPICVRLISDSVECTCADCEFSERDGTKAPSVIQHAAYHAIATGHTVTERHVRLSVISEAR